MVILAMPAKAASTVLRCPSAYARLVCAPPEDRQDGGAEPLQSEVGALGALGQAWFDGPDLVQSSPIRCLSRPSLCLHSRAPKKVLLACGGRIRFPRRCSLPNKVLHKQSPSSRSMSPHWSQASTIMLYILRTSSARLAIKLKSLAEAKWATHPAFSPQVLGCLFRWLSCLHQTDVGYSTSKKSSLAPGCVPLPPAMVARRTKSFCPCSA